MAILCRKVARKVVDAQSVNDEATPVQLDGQLEMIEEEAQPMEEVAAEPVKKNGKKKAKKEEAAADSDSRKLRLHLK